MTKADGIVLNLADFPAQTNEKIRWSDTDAAGHVNNLNFSVYCEIGRVALLRGLRVAGPRSRFTPFMARIAIDFRAQIMWPGTVEIGTGIKAIGRTSVTFLQGLFQNGKCVAEAEAVLVNVGKAGTPAVIDDEIKQHLTKYILT